MHLAAGGDHDRVGLPLTSLPEDVRTAEGTVRRGDLRAIERRQLLPGECQRNRPPVPLERDPPGHRGLVRIGRPHVPEVRDRAQRHVVLDRLVRGAILTDGHRVVRPDPCRPEAHQRGEPDSRTHVVREDQERRAVRAQHCRLERDPVHDRPHRVLADPERDVAAGMVGSEHARALELGLRRLDEVGGSTDQGRRERLQRLHHLPAGIARGHLLAGRKHRQGIAPAVSWLTPQVELALPVEAGERRRPPGEPLFPVALELGAAPGHRGHVLAHCVGDGEGRIRIHPHCLFRETHFGLAERRPVCLRRVHRMWSRVADVAADDDQGRPLLFCLGRREGAEKRVEVLGVADVLDVPAIGLEALALVLGRERERGRTVDRDVVVVVDVDETAEREMPGDRRGLVGDAFHQVAVGADRVDPGVDDLVVWPVVAIGEKALCDRHADAVPEPLAERPCRRLDAGCVPELRVTGRARPPLPELTQVVEREVVAREMQRGILEHAGMPRREDEPVPARPVRVGRVVPHHVAVEEIRQRRECHCRAGVAGIRLLHGIHRERPNRVDRLGARIGGHDVEHIRIEPAGGCGRPPTPARDRA